MKEILNRHKDFNRDSKETRMERMVEGWNGQMVVAVASVMSTAFRGSSSCWCYMRWPLDKTMSPLPMTNVRWRRLLSMRSYPEMLHVPSRVWGPWCTIGARRSGRTCEGTLWPPPRRGLKGKMFMLKPFG